MSSGLRVTVDHDVCVGNAMCRAIAPGVFVENGDGQSDVADPDAAPLAVIMEASELCPVGAIEVEGVAASEPIER